MNIYIYEYVKPPLPRHGPLKLRTKAEVAARSLTYRNKGIPSLAGWQGAAQIAAHNKQGLPCHFCQGLPGCRASSVLSLDIRSRSFMLESYLFNRNRFLPGYSEKNTYINLLVANKGNFSIFPLISLAVIQNQNPLYIRQGVCSSELCQAVPSEQGLPDQSGWFSPTHSEFALVLY